LRTRNRLFSLFVFLVAVPVCAAVYLGAVGLERERAMLVERERQAMTQRALDLRDGLVRELQRLYRREVARPWTAYLPEDGAQSRNDDRTGALRDRFVILPDRSVVLSDDSREAVPPDIVALADESPADRPAQTVAASWIATEAQVESLQGARPQQQARTRPDAAQRVRASGTGFRFVGDLAVRVVAFPDGTALEEGFRVDVARLERVFLDPDSELRVPSPRDGRVDRARIVGDDARLQPTPSRDAWDLPRLLYLSLLPEGRDPDPALVPPGHLLAVELRPSPSLADALDETTQRLWWTLGAVGLVTVLGLLFAWQAVRAETRLAERKAEFVSAVSHELRTPLTSIRMYADLLKEGWVKDGATAQDYFGLISAESERLARLVNNVLDFSRIEKGRKSFEMRIGDPAGVVREACGVLRPYLREKGFELDLAVPETLPACRFDQDALMQILVNLIDNAVKYGEREVRVEAETRDDRLVLRVLDRGPGVPPAERKSIFEPFTRGAAADRGGGSGLGLALVQHYVTQHHGTIEVADREGGGAIFALSLPLGG